MAYARVSKETRQKLDANAQRYAFVGYTNSTKQYKLYDPVKRKVTLSRDVEFEERRSYFRFQYSEEASSGRIFYYVPTEPPSKSMPDKGGTAGLSGPEGDDSTPQGDDHQGDTPQVTNSQGDTHQVMEPVTPSLTPELPGSFVDAPEVQLDREQVERDTRKKKRNFLRELALTDGTAWWDAPEESRTRRGVASMAVDVAMMVEKGPPTCRAALDSDEGAEWVAAIESEEASIMRNGTFEAV